MDTGRVTSLRATCAAGRATGPGAGLPRDAFSVRKNEVENPTRERPRGGQHRGCENVRRLGCGCGCGSGLWVRVWVWVWVWVRVRVGVGVGQGSPPPPRPSVVVVVAPRRSFTSTSRHVTSHHHLSLFIYFGRRDRRRDGTMGGLGFGLVGRRPHDACVRRMMMMRTSRTAPHSIGHHLPLTSPSRTRPFVVPTVRTHGLRGKSAGGNSSPSTKKEVVTVRVRWGDSCSGLSRVSRARRQINR